MKKMISILFCVLVLMAAAGCSKSPAEQSDPCDLRSGNYFIRGYEEINEAPYVHLDFDDYSFYHCLALPVDYTEKGSFVVKGNKLIATTDVTVYEFQIVGDSKLVLLSNGGKGPEYMQAHMVFSFEALGN